MRYLLLPALAVMFALACAGPFVGNANESTATNLASYDGYVFDAATGKRLSSAVVLFKCDCGWVYTAACDSEGHYEVYAPDHDNHNMSMEARCAGFIPMGYSWDSNVTRPVNYDFMLAEKL